MLSDQVIIISSGGSDLAAHLAFGLAQKNARVGVIGSLSQRGQEIVNGVDSLVFVEAALKSKAAIHAAFGECEKRLGPCHSFVHAELPSQSMNEKILIDSSGDDWQLGCEVPIKSAIYCFQAARKQMQKAGGSLVLLCPTLGLSGAPKRVAYSAAIEAQRALVKVSAKQWGKEQILVNALAINLATALEPGKPSPGTGALGYKAAALTRTETVGEDIAGIVAFLSSENQFITGTTLIADGGVWTAA